MGFARTLREPLPEGFRKAFAKGWPVPLRDMP